MREKNYWKNGNEKKNEIQIYIMRTLAHTTYIVFTLEYLHLVPMHLQHRWASTANGWFQFHFNWIQLLWKSVVGCREDCEYP